MEDVTSVQSLATLLETAPMVIVLVLVVMTAVEGGVVISAVNFPEIALIMKVNHIGSLTFLSCHSTLAF